MAGGFTSQVRKLKPILIRVTKVFLPILYLAVAGSKEIFHDLYSAVKIASKIFFESGDTYKMWENMIPGSDEMIRNILSLMKDRRLDIEGILPLNGYSGDTDPGNGHIDPLVGFCSQKLRT